MENAIDQLTANWPHRWFGFFNLPTENEIDIPQFSDFIEPDWLSGEKDKIINYLRNADCILAASKPPAKCFLCDEKVCLASFRSDGVWLWPTVLSHYVERHEIRLPDAFVEKIREGNYMPTECKLSHERLPWPAT